MKGSLADSCSMEVICEEWRLSSILGCPSSTVGNLPHTAYCYKCDCAGAGSLGDTPLFKMWMGVPMLAVADGPTAPRLTEAMPLQSGATRSYLSAD